MSSSKSSLASLFALHADPAQGFVTQSEFDRLFAELSIMPSTGAEDQTLLLSGTYAGMFFGLFCLYFLSRLPHKCNIFINRKPEVSADWKSRTILQMRILCKGAQQVALQKLFAAGMAGKISHVDESQGKSEL